MGLRPVKRGSLQFQVGCCFGGQVATKTGNEGESSEQYSKEQIFHVRRRPFLVGTSFRSPGPSTPNRFAAGRLSFCLPREDPILLADDESVVRAVGEGILVTTDTSSPVLPMVLKRSSFWLETTLRSILS